VPPTFGVDYTFERTSVTLDVNDEHDQGAVNLITYIYRPVGAHSGEVIVSTHGSLGGQALAPGEPFLPSRPFIAFAVQRGHILVVPYRRGFVKFRHSRHTFIMMERTDRLMVFLACPRLKLVGQSS
jgi:hypothetical protein